MNKDYKSTTERIRELVPRLKELSFGCEVKILAYTEENEEDFFFGKVFYYSFGPEGTGYRECGGEIIETPDVETLIVGIKGYDSEHRNDFIYENEGWKYEIIGHEPNLEDLLEALRKKMFPAGKRYIAEELEELRDLYKGRVLEIDRIWGYGKPFSEQEPTTQEFIAQLLK